jgi:pre-rRNA-processing protein TSR3
MEIQLIKLFGVHFDQCDPKKCSCNRLKKFNLITVVKRVKYLNRKTIILDPLSDKILSPDDAGVIQRYGLAIIDCSWANADSIFRKHFRTGRRLPKLIAANEVNYGRWERLNSAEALSAALIITGFKKKADEILSKFKWGNTFIDINPTLKAYLE